jgi:hypothetical protein
MSQKLLELSSDKFFNVNQVNYTVFFGKKVEFYFNGSDKAITVQFNA